MQDFFINEKPVKALIVLRRNREDMYCSKISKKVDTTYAHTVRIISRLEDEGLIMTQKKGRKKFIRLTEEGEEYAEKFQQLLELFEDDEELGVNNPLSNETMGAIEEV